MNVTKFQKIYTVILFCLLINIEANSQNGKLVGFVNGYLIEINQRDGSLQEIVSVDDFPSNSNLSGGLTWSTKDCLFYGIIDGLDNPKLISIDIHGTYRFIGEISVLGENIELSEAIAYNSIDNKLYAAVSFNGGLPTDFYSETLIELNPFDATGILRTRLSGGVTIDDDVDGMTFINNVLYFYDGNPSNSRKFYSLNFNGLGVNANPVLLSSFSYSGIPDITAIDNIVYAARSDLGFEYFSTIDNTLNYIGQTHAFPTYNGDPIRGLAYMPIQNMDVGLSDNNLCEGELSKLNIDLPEATIKWNTGESTNTITVDTSGEYWAELNIENCTYYTDTAIISFSPTYTDTLRVSACDNSIYQYNNQDLLPGSTTEFNFQSVNGCDSLITIEVLISDVTIYIPNVFSPNNDGINDCFRAYFNENALYSDYVFSIYDRWGEKVYEMTEIDQCWDGSLNGKLMNSAVFVWVLQGFNDVCDKKEIRRGEVTLVD